MRRELLQPIVIVVCAGAMVAWPEPGRLAAQTQAEMHEEASATLRATEAELKRVLDQLRAKAVGKKDALEKLRKVQVAWETYRDAQLGALWPAPDRGMYGSAHPMCVVAVRTELTKARIRELRDMLKPAEGDVCSSRWPE